ncbi:MAG TPA: peptidoglycan-binding domain-containing protein, partial [Methanosarcina sp.]|nr:peptidoglycan-binding domain-containing protein [Methanosarcina sp.]
MTIGDGHDLRSPRFAGDEVLEGCYDNERALQRGDSGSAVRKIQQALISLGFPVPEVGANGIFGNETVLAVRSYQEARGLSVDGIVGPETIGSLDEEFITGISEPSVLPAPEPHVSEVPTPLFPESPVRTPRASTVGPVRAPEIPRVRAPPVPEVHAPPVPVPEVPELATRVTPRGEKPPHVSRPATSRIQQIDSQGRKFHTAGTWSGNNSSFEAEAGKSIRLEVSNLNVTESSIRIKTNTGEIRESVLLPDTPVDFEFSTISEEPFIWR